ncbi:hypothetical protein BST61_g8368 [Cercospora zeina]
MSHCYSQRPSTSPATTAPARGNPDRSCLLLNPEITSKAFATWECETISGEEWAARVHIAISKMKQYFVLAASRYLDAAFRYHTIPIGCRATTVKLALCQLAHQQFGVENCMWDDDPFFEEWQSTIGTLRDLASEQSASMDEESRKQMAMIINETRATVNGIVKRMFELDQGVKRINAVQQELRQTEKWQQIVVKPSTKKNPKGKRDTRALQGAVAPSLGYVFFSELRRFEIMSTTVSCLRQVQRSQRSQ